MEASNITRRWPKYEGDDFCHSYNSEENKAEKFTSEDLVFLSIDCSCISVVL